MTSLYAELLKGSFESLKSATEPGQRPSGVAMIEVEVVDDPVVGKLIPVKQEVRDALRGSGYEVKDEDKEGKIGDPVPEVKPSLEAQSHDPSNVERLHHSGIMTGEQNLMVNGVYMPDTIEPKTTLVSIMTPNDVVNPEADVVYLTELGDDGDAVKEYLSTEGYKVVTSAEELIALLRA